MKLKEKISRHLNLLKRNKRIAGWTGTLQFPKRVSVRTLDGGTVFLRVDHLLTQKNWTARSMDREIFREESEDISI